MSTLTLIRHGQASFGTGNYDALSELGQRQCHALRDYWQSRGVEFDEVHAGTLRRQVDSARLALGEPQPDERWNEYNADAILQWLAPQLAATNEAFGPLHRAHQQNPQDKRVFQRMFEPLMRGWLTGAVQHAEVEPFAAFRDRVQSVLGEIVSKSGSRRVAVFTSGGPIGLALMTALAAPEPKALELNWRLRNASLTTLLFSPGRLSLDAFNTTPHLLPADETFR